MEFMAVSDMDDRFFAQVALNAIIDGTPGADVPVGIVANWVACNWPISYDSDPDTMALLEKWEWYLGSQGQSIPDWLSEHDGLPTLIAAASRGLEIVRTENLVSVLVEKHSDAIHEVTGVGPDEIRATFEVSLEFRLTNRDFRETAHTACVVFHGFDTALSTEVDQGNNSYELLSSMHLNRAYLHRLVKHSLKVRLAD